MGITRPSLSDTSLRELPPEGATFRLAPAVDDPTECGLFDAATTGTQRAAARLIQQLGGWDVASVLQNLDAKTPMLIEVEPSFLGQLDVMAAVDACLLAMDARTGHLRFADGSRRSEIPEVANAIIAPIGEAGITELRPGAAAHAVHSGMTLVANNLVPRMRGMLQRFVDDLARTTGAPPQVNLYMSERDAPGFGRHWDDHDVLVIQGHGQKQWRVFQPLTLSPRLGYAPVREFGKQVFSTVLRPGNALFIPRGWGHEVAGIDGELSLHYTVGLRFQTMVDVLEEARLAIGDEAANARVDTGGPFPTLGIDRSLVDHARGAYRARFTSVGGAGPVALTRAYLNDFDGASFRASLPGGLVFVDSPQKAASEVGFAAGTFRFALDQRAAGLLDRLLRGDAVTLDDSIDALDRSSARQTLELLLRRGVVGIDVP